MRQTIHIFSIALLCGCANAPASDKAPAARQDTVVAQILQQDSASTVRKNNFEGCYQGPLKLSPALTPGISNLDYSLTCYIENERMVFNHNYKGGGQTAIFKLTDMTDTSAKIELDTGFIFGLRTDLWTGDLGRLKLKNGKLIWTNTYLKRSYPWHFRNRTRFVFIPEGHSDCEDDRRTLREYPPRTK